ncbi:MAG: hypothetical protein ACTSU5_17185 [Promethearchaeota archaeon]
MENMAQDLGPQIRQLIMLISDLRAQDTERYKSHTQFMNEVVAMIQKIAENMNQNWQKIYTSLAALNETIKTSLDTLLTGINPEGIRETSFSLKEIMSTMNKSVQSMNLENIVRELRALMGGGVQFAPVEGGAAPEVIGAGIGSPGAGGGGGDQEIYGYVPPGMKAKEKKKEETHLLRPSDLFGSGLQADFDDPDAQQ